MIEWIVSSSVLILLVLAVRTLCRTRLSCRARYCLWLVVLVRLLTPVQLFPTGWGVAEIAELSLPNPVLMVSDPEGLLSDSAPLEPDPTLPRAEQEIQWRENRSEYYQQHIKEAEETGVRTVTLADALRAVWIAGAGVLAAVLLISNLRFVRRLRRTRRPCDALCAGMRVYVAEGLSSPCLVGVLRPTAYLTPESVRDERTLRHVLAHETTHRLHGDCLWSLLRLAALCLHWYNPLVWYAVLVSKRDGELACDEATLKRLGEDERAAYGETLLSLVRAATDTRELFSASTAMTAAPMRERIETIAKHPRTKLAALVFALAVLLTATVFAFSKGEERETAPMPEEQTEQRPAARDADSSETLRATGSYEVAAHRIAGSGWSVAIPDEGWTRAGDTWTSDAGSTLSVKWLASRDDCDLAPYMEHWDRASDELNTVTYEDDPNRLRMEAHLYAAPGGGYWQVLTRYDTSLLLLSSFTGLEPKLLEAMAASFRVDGTPEPPQSYDGAGSLVSGLPADVVARWEADFDGDGTMERLVLDTRGLTERSVGGFWLEDARGNQLRFLGEIAPAHAGWRTVALTELDGKTYLLEYSPAMYQGEAAYFYTLGGVVESSFIGGDRMEFSVNPNGMEKNDRAAMERFQARANELWSHSRLLFSTDREVLAHLYDADTGLAVETNGGCYITGEGETIRYYETMCGLLDDAAVPRVATSNAPSKAEVLAMRERVEAGMTDAESFRKRMTALKNSVKSGLLDEDLDRMIALCERAKETHDVDRVIELYHMLHDLDYFVLRYGPSDVGSRTEGPSVASGYYGCLSVWGDRAMM